MQEISDFKTALRGIHLDSTENITCEALEALAILRHKIRRTLEESNKGKLLDISERLELLGRDELDILISFLPLEEDYLIEMDLVLTKFSPIFEVVDDVSFTGVIKFKHQPGAGNSPLVMVCIENDGDDYAVGLVTQEELDLYAQDIVDDELRMAAYEESISH